jgi:hypothetical protein
MHRKSLPSDENNALRKLMVSALPFRKEKLNPDQRSSNICESQNADMNTTLGARKPQILECYQHAFHLDWHFFNYKSTAIFNVL